MKDKAIIVLFLLCCIFAFSSCSSTQSYKSCVPGDTLYFGTYEQDNEISNGQEKIEWIVLDKKENKLLIVSKYVLDSASMGIWEEYPYEDSHMRSWLNDGFYKKAFSSNEQLAICTTTLPEDVNLEYNTSNGNGSQDKVFLLSVNEVNTYFKTDGERTCSATPYAIAQGANTGSSALKHCDWWLRSKGKDSWYWSYVGGLGWIHSSGGGDDSGVGIRPALWLDLNA